LWQAAGVEWAHAAVAGSHCDLHTLGYSGDDVGIGDLDDKNVIAVNPQYWPGGSTGLQAFLNEHYPGVVYEEIVVATPAELELALRGSPPDPDPLPPTGGELISLHVQQWMAGVDYFINLVEPAVVKLVEGMEQAHRVKELSPKTEVLYRHYEGDQGQFWDMEPKAGARKFLETFLDSLHTNAAVIKWVEPLNEMIATDDLPGIERTVAFDVAWCEVLEEEGFPARPGVLTAGVGNPQHGAQTEMLLPAIKAATDAGGVVVGPHAYWGAVPGYCTLDEEWDHYSGRGLESWDYSARTAGIYPHYVFGEGGAVYVAPNGSMPSAYAGWRDKATLGGDWETYLAQILQWRQKAGEWNERHADRCLGLTIFTISGYGEWKYFELGEYELRALADALTGQS